MLRPGTTWSLNNSSSQHISNKLWSPMAKTSLILSPNRIKKEKTRESPLRKTRPKENNKKQKINKEKRLKKCSTFKFSKDVETNSDLKSNNLNQTKSKSIMRMSKQRTKKSIWALNCTRSFKKEEDLWRPVNLKTTPLALKIYPQ